MLVASVRSIPLLHHSMNVIVQTVLTSTFNFYGNRQTSTPYKINTPEPITKIRHNWLRPRKDPYTKFGTNLPTEGFWANGWNITKIIIIYLYTFFLRHAHRSDRWMDFLRAIAQKTWNYASMCLFEVIKLKCNFKPPIYLPKPSNFGPKGTFFDRKRLTLGHSRINYP